MKYRDFTIEYNPPPIPVRCCDWQFWHDDYDGAPNNPGEGPADNRCGSAGSLDDAKLEIDMILEDWGTDRCPTEAEKAAQAARCSCRGADDYCPCQNVVQP